MKISVLYTTFLAVPIQHLAVLYTTFLAVAVSDKVRWLVTLSQLGNEPSGLLHGMRK